MTKHTHDFISNYNGIGAYGFDRNTDEETIIYYLQKFSDDTFIKTLTKRVSDEELDEIYNFINKFLKKYLNEQEYHSLFLKDNHHQ